MKPIPVVFHIGPLQVHTYGIGLALTFWFAFTYFERRLRKNGYPTDWFVSVFLWIILAAVVGARALHVLSNLSYYTPQSGPGARDLARRALLVRRTPLRGADRPHPDPPPLSGAADRTSPGHHRPGAPGGVGHGPAARTPADGGRWRAPHPPVVRHVLRRPARTATARAHLPGGGGLRCLLGADLHRATPGPMARWIAPHRLPDRHGHRHRHGAVGDRAGARRAPVARRGRPPRLAARPDCRRAAGRGRRGRLLAHPTTLEGLATTHHPPAPGPTALGESPPQNAPPLPTPVSTQLL